MSKYLAYSNSCVLSCPLLFESLFLCLYNLAYIARFREKQCNFQRAAIPLNTKRSTGGRGVSIIELRVKCMCHVYEAAMTEKKGV
jgi:hypothetical protein